jgi:hypothetical protein
MSKPALTRMNSDRGQDRFEDMEIVRVAFPREQGDVEVVARAFAVAEKANRPGAGVERGLVGRKIEHVGPFVERPLGAVAVVEVPIDDEDPAEAVAAAEVLGADGDVVEDAEAHGPGRLGVMPRGAHQGQGVGDGPVHDPVERLEEAARREKRGRPGLRAGRRIHVQGDGLAGRGPDEVDIAALVDGRELVLRRGAWGDRQEGDGRVVFEQAGQGLDARRRLDMPGAHVVVHIAAVNDNAGLHRPSKKGSNLPFATFRTLEDKCTSEYLGGRPGKSGKR